MQVKEGTLSPSPRQSNLQHNTDDHKSSDSAQSGHFGEMSGESMPAAPDSRIMAMQSAVNPNAVLIQPSTTL